MRPNPYIPTREISTAKLPYRDVLAAILDQVEWIIFRALLQDIEIDRRSLSAVIDAKRTLLGGVRDKNWENIESQSEDVFFENGGNDRFDNEKCLNQCTLAYVCWCVVNDAHSLHNVTRERDYIVADYLSPFGALGKESPLWRWLDEIHYME